MRSKMMVPREPCALVPHITCTDCVCQRGKLARVAWVWGALDCKDETQQTHATNTHRLSASLAFRPHLLHSKGNARWDGTSRMVGAHSRLIMLCRHRHVAARLAHEKAAACTCQGLCWKLSRREVVQLFVRRDAITHSPQLAKEPTKLPSVSAGAPSVQDWAGDLLVVGVFEEGLDVTGVLCCPTHADARRHAHLFLTDDAVGMKSPALQQLDSALGGVVSDILALGDFKAKQGASSPAMRVGGKAKFVQLVGLGPAANATAISTWGPAPMQTLGMSIATGAKTVKAASAAVVLVDAPTMSPELQANIACKVCASGCKRKGIVAGPFFGLVTATLVFNW